MSVSAQNVSQSTVSGSGQTVFPFTFRCDDSTLLKVYANDVDMGVPAIALNADQVANPGGTVTLAARAALDIITIERLTPQTQVTAFNTYQPFPSSAVSVALDKVVMLLQEFWALVARVPRLPRSWATKMLSMDLPAPVIGSSIGWGDAGGGKYSFVNLPGGGGGGGSGAGTLVVGEAVGDSGDHINFNLAHVPRAGTLAVYRTGQRVFNPADYTLAGQVVTLVVALVPASGERLDADYTY
jgi:hypothetical protein